MSERTLSRCGLRIAGSTFQFCTPTTSANGNYTLHSCSALLHNLIALPAFATICCRSFQHWSFADSGLKLAVQDNGLQMVSPRNTVFPTELANCIDMSINNSVDLLFFRVIISKYFRKIFVKITVSLSAESSTLFYLYIVEMSRFECLFTRASLYTSAAYMRVNIPPAYTWVVPPFVKMHSSTRRRLDVRRKFLDNGDALTTERTRWACVMP
jgi:hypothetical protein